MPNNGQLFLSALSAFLLNSHQSVCMNKEIPFLPFLNYGITSSELISSQVFLIIFNPFLILFYGYQKIIQTAFCTRSRSLWFLFFLQSAREWLERNETE